MLIYIDVSGHSKNLNTQTPKLLSLHGFNYKSSSSPPELHRLPPLFFFFSAAAAPLPLFFSLSDAKRGRHASTTRGRRRPCRLDTSPPLSRRRSPNLAQPNIQSPHRDVAPIADRTTTRPPPPRPSKLWGPSEPLPNPNACQPLLSKKDPGLWLC